MEQQTENYQKDCTQEPAPVPDRTVTVPCPPELAREMSIDQSDKPVTKLILPASSIVRVNGTLFRVISPVEVEPVHWTELVEPEEDRISSRSARDTTYPSRSPRCAIPVDGHAQTDLEGLCSSSPTNHLHPEQPEQESELQDQGERKLPSVHS